MKIPFCKYFESLARVRRVAVFAAASAITEGRSFSLQSCLILGDAMAANFAMSEHGVSYSSDVLDRNLAISGDRVEVQKARSI